MTYFIAYLLLGISMTIFVYLTVKESKLELWLVLVCWLIWPMVIAAMLQRYLVMLKVHHTTRRCAYCDAVFKTDEIRKHVLNECDMNPLRMKIAEAQGIILNSSYTDRGRIVLLHGLLSENVE